MRAKPTSDSDSPWKESLEMLLAQFLGYCLPDVHAAVDWTRPYKSLDKELHQIMPKAKLRRRLADKLFQVWLKNGKEAWLLIHVEVQGRREKDFAERMFIYSYRIYDRYGRLAASVAVLCDANPEWKPGRFEYNNFGCEMRFRYRVVKLLDYRGKEAELEADPNPFAAVILAQLVFERTRNSPEERRVWKVRLIKSLYRRGLTAEQIRQMFRLIDWILMLPEDLDELAREEVQRFEEEQTMAYVTSFERLARKEGIREGLLEAIMLAVKGFGREGKNFARELSSVKDIDVLRNILKGLHGGKTLEELRELLS